jgi:hypothetical protein
VTLLVLAAVLAVRLRAVPVRDGDFADPGRYCPPDLLVVSWAPPAGRFRFGAHIPPLGPAPGPATTSVNGVVTCRGATYAYMGFEARWAHRGLARHRRPVAGRAGSSPTATRPGRAAAAADALPPSGSGPLDDLAPNQPQTTCSPPAKPGVDGFRRIVLTAFPGTPSYGVSRDCSVGGPSEHKEGRAWDWGVAATNAGDRRRIWASYRAEEGWRPYVGPTPTPTTSTSASAGPAPASRPATGTAPRSPTPRPPPVSDP